MTKSYKIQALGEKRVPALRMTGKWLESVGIGVGEYIDVTLQDDGALVLRKMPLDAILRKQTKRQSATYKRLLKLCEKYLSWHGDWVKTYSYDRFIRDAKACVQSVHFLQAQLLDEEKKADIAEVLSATHAQLAHCEIFINYNQPYVNVQLSLLEQLVNLLHVCGQYLGIVAEPSTISGVSMVAESRKAYGGDAHAS